MGGKVQVIVVDNFSLDNTRDVVAEFAYRGDVVYRKHKQPADTAEESLLNGLEFAETDYIWSLGDDDVVPEDAVRRVMQIVSMSSCDFILLNMVAKVGEKHYTYFRAPYPTITYAQGIDLFRDFGLISATTTISCLCFRKSRLLTEEWHNLRKISSIYSHSVAFFLSFRNCPCAFLETPCVIYTLNTIAEELQRFAIVAKSSGEMSFHAYTVGLIGLINTAAALAGISVADLADFEEIELSKTSFRVFNTTVALFIARMVLRQLIVTLQKNDPAFSVSQTALINEFFSRAGDLWCMATVRHAFEIISDNTLSTIEKSSLLNQYFNALHGLETRRFASAGLAPDSWRKSYYLFTGGVPFKAGRGVPGDAHGRPQSGFPENRTRLTILIPSYNRARNLACLLRNLHRMGVQKIAGVEVLVADNCSTDRTGRVCRAAAILLSNLRSIHYTRHMGSAEENIDTALREAKGDYVWFLGDDQEIVRPVFYLLLNLIWYGDYSCLVFNNLLPQERLKRANSRKAGLIDRYYGTGQIKLDEPLSSGSLQPLVKQFGLTTGMAFISRYVLKRSEIQSYKHYSEISSIFSLVFGFMESFSGREITFVNYPLTSYNDSRLDGQKFQLGDRNCRPFCFHWINDLIQLTLTAAEHGIVDGNFLREVREIDPYGNPFDLELEMRLQVIRQLIRYTESFHSRQLPSVNHIEEFFLYFREENGQLNKIDCYLFLLYLKLAQKEMLRCSEDEPSPALIADLAVIRGELCRMLDCLASNKPFRPFVKSNPVRYWLARVAKKSPILEATLKRMLRITRRLIKPRAA